MTACVGASEEDEDWLSRSSGEDCSDEDCPPNRAGQAALWEESLCDVEVALTIRSEELSLLVAIGNLRREFWGGRDGYRKTVLNTNFG